MATICLPALTLAQMQDVEQRMEAAYRLHPLQIMENAARGLAALARRVLEDDIEDRPLVVLAGDGRKGGVGLAAARHLVNWGAWVQVLCTVSPDEYMGAAAQQLRALQAAGTACAWAEDGWELPPCDLVIDALDDVFADGMESMEMVAYLIELANSSMAPILSGDAPTGVDLTSGKVQIRTIQADATLALGLPKAGTLVEPGRAMCGDLYLADIGVPQLLLEEMDMDVPPIFARDTLLAVTVVDGVASVDV